MLFNLSLLITVRYIMIGLMCDFIIEITCAQESQQSKYCFPYSTNLKLLWLLRHPKEYVARGYSDARQLSIIWDDISVVQIVPSLPYPPPPCFGITSKVHMIQMIHQMETIQPVISLKISPFLCDLWVELFGDTADREFCQSSDWHSWKQSWQTSEVLLYNLHHTS